MRGASRTSERLGRRFFRRDAESLAIALLGQVLVRVLESGEVMAGRIVETEAYLGVIDRAAHTFGGRRTARNESMYLDAGHAYVYFTYGMHYCVNITADAAEVPTACLIRALEPIEGVELMRERRGGRADGELCSGPAKLTQAMNIDRSLDGIDLVSDPRLYLRRGRLAGNEEIIRSKRIGVGYAKDWADKMLRFYVRGNPHVSRK
ncbi:MAG: DNA-3-methyladenine glycosylase [Planctomycetes bacterium]|nr:DNA-3-methyladenine glycosylase [Planctomycetota bacterium]